MDTASLSAPCFISPPEFVALHGRPGAPLVLDVRPPPRFAASDRLLCSAQRCAPDDIAQLVQSQAPRDVDAYCVYGHAVSQGAVQALRDAGWNARCLAGGFEGGEPGVDTSADIAAWRAPPLPSHRWASA